MIQYFEVLQFISKDCNNKECAHMCVLNLVLLPEETLSRNEIRTLLLLTQSNIQQTALFVSRKQTGGILESELGVWLFYNFIIRSSLNI